MALKNRQSVLRLASLAVNNSVGLEEGQV
jgi:hypothetical protein